jgi:hypothetical protein
MRTIPDERCGPARSITPSDLLHSAAEAVAFAKSIGLWTCEDEVRFSSIGADAPLPGVRDPATRLWCWDRNAVRVWAQQLSRVAS